MTGKCLRWRPAAFNKPPSFDRRTAAWWILSDIGVHDRHLNSRDGGPQAGKGARWNVSEMLGFNQTWVLRVR
jgi:hypothetical protein